MSVSEWLAATAAAAGCLVGVYVKAAGGVGGRQRLLRVLQQDDDDLQNDNSNERNTSNSGRGNLACFAGSDEQSPDWHQQMMSTVFQNSFLLTAVEATIASGRCRQILFPCSFLPQQQQQDPDPDPRRLEAPSATRVDFGATTRAEGASRPLLLVPRPGVASGLAGVRNAHVGIGDDIATAGPWECLVFVPIQALSNTRTTRQRGWRKRKEDCTPNVHLDSDYESEADSEYDSDYDYDYDHDYDQPGRAPSRWCKEDGDCQQVPPTSTCTAQTNTKTSTQRQQRSGHSHSHSFMHKRTPKAKLPPWRMLEAAAQLAFRVVVPACVYSNAYSPSTATDSVEGHLHWSGGVPYAPEPRSRLGPASSAASATAIAATDFAREAALSLSRARWRAERATRLLSTLGPVWANVLAGGERRFAGVQSALRLPLERGAGDGCASRTVLVRVDFF
jgi:hypothetical protein